MNATLAAALWGKSRNSLARKAVLAVAGTVLLTVSSKFQIPFYPVPMTMQTFVVLMLGMTLGWRLAGVTMVLYLAEGAMGLPVFAGTPEKGMGLLYMTGPTGGYLAGFLFAAVLCGCLAERGWGRSAVKTASAMLAGNIVIYACGAAWLGSVVGWDKPVLSLGVYPFLYGDVVKIALAAAVMPMCWRLLGAGTK